MDFNSIPTPCFVVDEDALRRNLRKLGEVKQRTGCSILLALKGFAMWHVFPLLRESLDGVCASSPWEARLGREEFGGEVHAYAAAYSRQDVCELLDLCDEIDFNSFSQWKGFKPLVVAEQQRRNESGRPPLKVGLRVNPQCSTGRTALYDPCAPRSRLGILRRQFDGESLDAISGLHFHTLCEQNADALEVTLRAVEAQFGDLLERMEWVNFGGGHHITREDYDVDLLCDLITRFKQRYGVQVILEPGEAVALNAGVLIATVLDVIDNGGPVAILDCSCTCHMPDVLEMPYRPGIEGAGLPGAKAHTYRLAGLSCLAGDVIGDYSFEHRLSTGDRLIFKDMAHYTMVKTTFFNGVRHPSIAIRQNDGCKIVRQFNYLDYKNKLS